jgi:hypothetical protein
MQQQQHRKQPRQRQQGDDNSLDNSINGAVTTPTLSKEQRI